MSIIFVNFQRNEKQPSPVVTTVSHCFRVIVLESSTGRAGLSGSNFAEKAWTPLRDVMIKGLG